MLGWCKARDLQLAAQRRCVLDAARRTGVDHGRRQLGQFKAVDTSGHELPTLDDPINHRWRQRHQTAVEQPGVRVVNHNAITIDEESVAVAAGAYATKDVDDGLPAQLQHRHAGRAARSIENGRGEKHAGLPRDRADLDVRDIVAAPDRLFVVVTKTEAPPDHLRSRRGNRYALSVEDEHQVDIGVGCSDLAHLSFSPFATRRYRVIDQRLHHFMHREIGQEVLRIVHQLVKSPSQGHCQLLQVAPLGGGNACKTPL
jgi:hypothetical protein